MRILLVNQHTVPVFADIAIAFARRGHEVRLFAGYVEPGSRWNRGDVSVVNSIAYRRNSALSRLLTWSLFTIHYLVYGLMMKKPDRILVSTNPPLAPLITKWIARIRAIPFYVLVYDLYPDALVQAGFMSTGNFLYRGWQRRNRKLFSQSKGIFTLSESMKTALSEYADVRNVTVIPNWSDIDFIKPISKADNPFVTRHGLASKFVVMYSGNMGLTHDLRSMIEAAILLREHPGIAFALIGDGGRRRELIEMTANNKLSNVQFLDYQDSQNFPLAVAAADVGIITLGTGAEGISVPSKTYVSLAAGQCVVAIAPHQSELSRIVEELGVGFVVPPHNAALLAKNIKFLFDSPAELTKFRSRSREVSKMFTPDKADEYVKAIFP